MSGVVVASHYDGVVKELIQRLKYHRARRAAPILAKLLVPFLEAGKYDFVTSVPAATNRYRQRSYNQAEIIAREVASNMSLPYRTVLRRTSNVQQVGHSRAERLSQAANVFWSSSDIAGTRVLIVDDVLTTGATLNACAVQLKKAGAKNVWGAVTAKH